MSTPAPNPSWQTSYQRNSESWWLFVGEISNMTRNFKTQAHNKGVKLRSYAPNEKIWLNNKYIKTKRNRKLEVKFFGPFRVLHPVGKQAYKLEFSIKWRIYDVFYVLLLKQHTARKKRVDEENTKEGDVGNKGKYEVKAIWDSAVYAKESELGHLQGLYYLVSWKRYLEEENTWELASAI